MRGRAIFALALWITLWPTPAPAAQPQYCMLYAREWLKVQAGQLEPADAATITAEALAHMLGQAQSGCILVDEPPDFKPGEIESDEAFLAHVLAALHTVHSGAPPAPIEAVAPDPPVIDRVCGRRSQPEGAAGTPKRAAWCKAHYGSFSPKDGTVKCRGQRKRSPCA